MQNLSFLLQVPPHHIKTYQIEKYDDNNLESVMSAVHFMVTTQHFVKGQMRVSLLKFIEEKKFYAQEILLFSVEMHRNHF